MIDILIRVLGTLVTYFTGKNVIKFDPVFFIHGPSLQSFGSFLVV